MHRSRTAACRRHARARIGRRRARRHGARIPARRRSRRRRSRATPASEPRFQCRSRHRGHERSHRRARARQRTSRTGSARSHRARARMRCCRRRTVCRPLACVRPCSSPRHSLFQTRAMTFEKLKSAIMLALAAIRAPGAALYAVRERGLGHVVRRFAESDPSAARALATDVRARSAPATLGNLRAYYREFRFSPADPDHLLVELPTGQNFYVRIARGWHDVGTLHDTFVKQIYSDHPPLTGARVLDIGANIGDTAVYFGARGAHVVAFEPDPEMCALARRNVSLNGVDAEIRNAGVGGESATLRLSAAAGVADSMSTTLFPGRTPANRLHVRTIDVDVVGFADVLTTCGPFRLVKFDCEGCEHPALTSLPDDGLAAAEYIIMEHHGHDDELASALRRLGFSVRNAVGPYIYAQRRSPLEGPVHGRPE